MRRLVAVTCLVGIVTMITGSRVEADATLQPTDDTFVRSTSGEQGTNFDEYLVEGPISVTATGYPSGSPTDIGYLRFDLSDRSGTITGARLRVWNRLWPGPTTSIAVYDPGSDDWNGSASGIGGETTLTFSNAPNPLAGEMLDTPVVGNSTTPGWIEFSGTEFLSYVQAQYAGDAIITFVLRVTSTGFADLYAFEDRENTTATGHRPELVLEGDLPVEIEGMSATRVGDDVRLAWRTVSEHKHAGFQVVREDRHGMYVPVTAELLRGSHAGELGGSDYEYLDRGAPPHAVRYWIDDVDVLGRATRHGPIEAPQIELVPWSPRLRGLRLRVPTVVVE